MKKKQIIYYAITREKTLDFNTLSTKRLGNTKKKLQNKDINQAVIDFRHTEKGKIRPVPSIVFG